MQTNMAKIAGGVRKREFPKLSATLAMGIKSGLVSKKPTDMSGVSVDSLTTESLASASLSSSEDNTPRRGMEAPSGDMRRANSESRPGAQSVGLVDPRSFADPSFGPSDPFARNMRMQTFDLSRAEEPERLLSVPGPQLIRYNTFRAKLGGSCSAKKGQ